MGLVAAAGGVPPGPEPEKASKESKQAPEVTVTTSTPKPRINRWKFELERDFNGKLKTITATAD